MPAFGLLPSSLSSPYPVVTAMNSSSSATNPPPPSNSSISAPQFTFGTSVTTCPVPTSSPATTLSPSFTPFYPQSRQQHSQPQPGFMACSAGHESYYPCQQPRDDGHQNYYSYAPQSENGSGASNYTGYSSFGSDSYNAAWTPHGFYGGQSYNPWGSHGPWQGFWPGSGYTDNSQWGDPFSVDYSYANPLTGEPRSSPYYPVDSSPYFPESPPAGGESSASSPMHTTFFPVSTSIAGNSSPNLSKAQSSSLPFSPTLSAGATLRASLCTAFDKLTSNGEWLEASQQQSPIDSLRRRFPGAYVASNLFQSSKSLEQVGSAGNLQNSKDFAKDIGSVGVPSLTNLIRKRGPGLIDDLEEVGSDEGEEDEDIEDGFGIGEFNRRRCKGRHWFTSQDRTIQEQSRQTRSTSGLTHTVSEVVAKQSAANSAEDQQLQVLKETLIQNTSFPNLAHGSPGKGATSGLLGTDVSSVSPHVSSELLYNVACSKGTTSGLRDEDTQGLDSASVGNDQLGTGSVHSSSFESSRHAFTKGIHDASNDISGGIGHERVPIESMGSKHLGAQENGATLSMEQKTSFKPSPNEQPIPLVPDSTGSFHEERGVNDILAAQKNKDIAQTSCDLDISHTDKVSSNVCPHTKVLSPSNGCQLLITSIYNLSKVLLVSQSVESSNCSEYMDMDALQNSICILSTCLLKQSSDKGAGKSHEPIVKMQQNFQGELKGQEVVAGQECNKVEAEDSRAGLENMAGSQKCSTRSSVSTQPADVGFTTDVKNALYEKVVFPQEKVMPLPSDERDVQGTCLETNVKVIVENYLENGAEHSLLRKHLEKPLKELAELQGMLMKLQEEIAYERRESNATVLAYKNLWRDAEEALLSSRSEILKTKLELEGLKQAMKESKHSERDYVDFLDITFPSESSGCETCMDGSKHEGSHENFLGLCMHGSKHEGSHETFPDLTPTSRHSFDEHHLSDMNTRSEGNFDLLGSSGQSQLRGEDVLARSFGPVKSVEVDSELAHPFPDARQVISRFSLLQAREDFKSTEDTEDNICKDLLQSSLDPPIRKINDIEGDLALRLCLLQARQAFDLKSSCNDLRCSEASATWFPASTDEYVECVTNVQKVGGAMPMDGSASLFQGPLQAETSDAECVEQQGSGNVGSSCLKSSSVSIAEARGREKTQMIINSLENEGKVQAEGGNPEGLELEGCDTIVDQSLNSQSKEQAALVLEDEESKRMWNMYQQADREIICLRPSEAEDCVTCIEGDAEWEHVLVSQG